MRGLSLDSYKSHRKENECKDSHDSQSGKIQTIGGHAENFSVQDGFLVKKTNQTEGRFYQHLMHDELGLSNFVPKCVNVEYSAKDLKLKKEIQGYSKVTLEDLRQGFKAPLIYDIKLGIRTVSSKELRVAGSSCKDILRKDLSLHIADKISSSSRSGYRFVGSSISHDSRFFLGTHPDQTIQEMGAHLCSRDLSLVLVELENILSYLRSKEGRKFEFIGASVLIVAESDPNSKESVQRAAPKVKLIDFAHSNMLNPTGIVLDNGILQTPYRKRLYQKGLTYGLANFADDLRVMLDNKQS